MIDLVGVAVAPSGDPAARAIRGLTFACPASVVVKVSEDSTGQCRMFLDLLAGTLVPECGTYLLAGHDINALPAAARRAELARHVGASLRADALRLQLTVAQNVALALTAIKAPDAFALERALAELELLGLTSFANAFPVDLSPAQLRLTSIARALVTRPRLILCEAPEEHLGARQIAALRLRLWNAVHVDSACVVMCTQNESLSSLTHTTLTVARDS